MFILTRQLGSYPVVCVLRDLNPHDFFDVIVVDHGPRSVTCLPYPFDMRSATLEQLTMVPGVGRKKAARALRSGTVPEELAALIEHPS